MGTQGYTQDDMVDLIVSVDEKHPQDKSFVKLFDTEYQRFTFVNNIMRDDPKMMVGGENFRWWVSAGEGSTAQFVLPGQVFTPSITDHMKALTAPIRHTDVHWTILDEEILACRGKEHLVNYLLDRRQGAQYDLAKLIEQQFLAAPDATSDITPLTLPYWLPPITATQVTDAATNSLEGDWQGTYATGYSDLCGQDPAVVTRLKSYNAQGDSGGLWTTTQEERMLLMLLNMDFDVPYNMANMEKPYFKARRTFTNTTTYLSMRQALKNQNDDLGADLDTFPGGFLFSGQPVQRLRALDTYDACRGYYPTYTVNFSTMHAALREGEVFLTKTFPATGTQPDATVRHTRTSYQFICTNRQMAGGVLSYVAAG